MRYSVLGLLSLAMLAAAGCAGRSDAGQAGDGPTTVRASAGSEPLVGQTFTGTALTEHGAPRALVPGTRIELRFTEDGRLVANAGCNTITGRVTVSAGRLDTDELSITELGCDPPRHEQDQRLSAFLAGRPSWRLDGDTLVLSDAGTTMTLTRVASPPLAGTTWRIDTLIRGAVAGSAPAGIGATLVFGAEEVTVSGLCNLRAVHYQAAGDTITFELGPLTRMACAPEVMRVEDAAVAVLDGQTSYRIDSRTLTITKGDTGLGLTAAG
jgi:heat shock protein HslJ